VDFFRRRIPDFHPPHDAFISKAPFQDRTGKVLKSDAEPPDLWTKQPRAAGTQPQDRRVAARISATTARHWPYYGVSVSWAADVVTVMGGPIAKDRWTSDARGVPMGDFGGVGEADERFPEFVPADPGNGPDRRIRAHLPGVCWDRAIAISAQARISDELHRKDIGTLPIPIQRLF